MFQRVEKLHQPANKRKMAATGGPNNFIHLADFNFKNGFGFPFTNCLNIIKIWKEK